MSDSPALVSVTFDNLGEASELEAGAWPDDRPLGEHFSVVEILPGLLERLREREIAATFFVEGLNAELYPGTLRDMAAAGHEVALHAWRHEQWRRLDPGRERELLARSRAAMDSVPLAATGFRPPGGVLAEAGTALLEEHGFSYCSPAGKRPGRLGKLAVLPFRWRLIDAYFYLPHFGALRERDGASPEPQPPSAMSAAVCAALDEHAAGGGHLPLLFHPFLLSMGDEAEAALERVLDHLAELVRSGAVSCLRMDEAARRLGEHPDQLGAPELDTASWSG